MRRLPPIQAPEPAHGRIHVTGPHGRPARETPTNAYDVPPGDSGPTTLSTATTLANFAIDDGVAATTTTSSVTEPRRWRPRTTTLRSPCWSARNRMADLHARLSSVLRTKPWCVGLIRAASPRIAGLRFLGCRFESSWRPPRRERGRARRQSRF